MRMITVVLMIETCWCGHTFGSSHGNVELTAAGVSRVDGEMAAERRQ